MDNRYRQKAKERHNLIRKKLRALVSRGWLGYTSGKNGAHARVTVTKLQRKLKTARGLDRLVISRLLKGQIGKWNFDPTKGMAEES